MISKWREYYDTVIKPLRDLLKFLIDNKFITIYLIVGVTTTSIVYSMNTIKYKIIPNMSNLINLTYEEKVFTTREFNKITEHLLSELGSTIFSYTKGEGDFMLVIIDWQIQGNPHIPELQARYQYVKSYRLVEFNESGKSIKRPLLVDVKHELKDKGQELNKHDYKSSKYNIDTHYNNGPGTYQTTDNYEAIVGGAVPNMFSNYPFYVKSRVGATYVPSNYSNYATRYLIMMDEVVDSLYPSQEAIKGIEKLRNDHSRILSK